MGISESKNSDSADVRLSPGEEIETSAPEAGQTFAVDNDVRVVVEDGSLPPLDGKPAKTADRPAWVDYCVSLGADRDFLENDTEHVVDATPGNEVVEASPPLTVKDLKDLAKRLGG
jgi:hypothetical protein